MLLSYESLKLVPWVWLQGATACQRGHLCWSIAIGLLTFMTTHEADGPVGWVTGGSPTWVQPGQRVFEAQAWAMLPQHVKGPGACAGALTYDELRSIPFFTLFSLAVHHAPRDS